MIVIGCVLWNSVYGWDDFPSSGDRTWSTRPVDQGLTGSDGIGNNEDTDQAAPDKEESDQ